MDGWSESNSLATAISKHLDLFVKSVWVFVEIIRNLISCQTSIMFSCLLAGIRLMISSRSFTSHFINMETGRVPQLWSHYSFPLYYNTKGLATELTAIHSSLVETKLTMHWIVWTAFCHCLVSWHGELTLCVFSEDLYLMLCKERPYAIVMIFSEEKLWFPLS